MSILFLFIGIIIGGVIVFLYTKNKTSQNSNDIELQNQINVINQTNAVLTERVNNLTTEREKSEIQSKQTIERLNAELKEEREKLESANKSLEKARTLFVTQEEKIKEYKAEVENQQKKLTTEFENIANKILDEKSKKFTEQNKVNIDGILTPLKERIKDFEEKVEKTYKTESDERIQLKTEIKSLVELNNKISKEANNLASALKGDNKMQGNWGEVILEKILERSGLVKDREYRTQVTTQNVSGQTIKPDVIIYLPDGKHIIIDSKVSLIAYEAYTNSETQIDRDKFSREHITSVKAHIKGLSDKDYQTSEQLNTPDFVLLFIPIESSFSLAVQADQELFNYAWERKIVIVSPSTLLATLLTIASVWKQERQNKNALEIARIGGSLYDEIYRFLEDMQDLNKNLQKSQESYNKAFKRLSEGRGNLLNTAEKIKNLGAKATKSIDRELLADEEETTKTNE